MTLLYLEVRKYVRGQFNGQFYPSGPFSGNPGAKIEHFKGKNHFSKILHFLSNFKGKNHFSKILHFLVFFKANLATLRYFIRARRGRTHSQG